MKPEISPDERAELGSIADTLPNQGAAAAAIDKQETDFRERLDVGTKTVTAMVFDIDPLACEPAVLQRLELEKSILYILERRLADLPTRRAALVANFEATLWRAKNIIFKVDDEASRLVPNWTLPDARYIPERAAAAVADIRRILR